MRIIGVLFFTLRLLVVSAVIYNCTRPLPNEVRSRIRYRNTLRGARLIADFCLHRGGIFLKAAQYLSTISNLFDAEFSEIFAGVPDRSEPRPYELVRYRFRAEFAAEPEELFREFDRTPLAAASLGQVHVGRLHDGRKVAIKFLHPNMESLVRQDLRAFGYVTHLILFFYGHLDFRGHLTEFSNMVQMEIDYQNEAENMRRVRDNFHDDPRIIVPEVITEFSRSTVLTTEYIEGIHVGDLKRLDRHGVDRRAVTELLVESYARMLFEHRFYHADPHPGNIFVVTSDSLYPIRLAFVDFGATQMITERMLEFIRRAIEIMRARDIPAVIELALESGILHEGSDQEVYTNLAELIYSRYAAFKLDEHYRINPVRFGRVIKMRDLNGVGLRLREIIGQVKLPRQYIYLGRTLTMLLSQAGRLDDKVNVFRVAKPHIDRYLGLRLRGVMNYLRRGAFGTILKRLENGGERRPAVSRALIETQRNTARLYYDLGQQTVFSVLGFGFAGLAAYLHVFGSALYSERALYVSAACFVWVVWRMFGVRRRGF